MKLKVKTKQQHPHANEQVFENLKNKKRSIADAFKKLTTPKK